MSRSADESEESSSDENALGDEGGLKAPKGGSTSRSFTGLPGAGGSVGGSMCAPMTPPGPAHIKLETCKMVEEDYIIGAKLGEGTFGVVYQATQIATGETVALKKIAKDRSGHCNKSWEREIHVLRSVSHPHIVYAHAVLESAHYVFLVMELCQGGTLADHLESQGANFRCPEDIASRIMAQLASAVSYLHRKSIVHRDIKPDNLLMIDIDTIKLTDFGLSLELRKTEDTMIEFCGTPLYMAPEICSGRSYSRQCDVWSMGVILHLILVGLPLFKSTKEEDLYTEIRDFTVDKLELPDDISERAKHCFKRLLHPDPGYRYSASEFLVDPWITGTEMEGSRTTNVLQLMKEFHIDNRSNSLDESQSLPPSIACSVSSTGDKSVSLSPNKLSVPDLNSKSSDTSKNTYRSNHLPITPRKTGTKFTSVARVGAISSGINKVNVPVLTVSSSTSNLSIQGASAGGNVRRVPSSNGASNIQVVTPKPFKSPLLSNRSTTPKQTTSPSSSAVPLRQRKSGPATTGLNANTGSDKVFAATSKTKR